MFLTFFWRTLKGPEGSLEVGEKAGDTALNNTNNIPFINALKPERNSGKGLVLPVDSLMGLLDPVI